MPPSKELVDRLREVRAILRRTVVEASLAGIVAIAVPVMMLAALTDFALRLPAGVRVVMLILAIAWLVLAVRRRLWPALRFRPSLVDVALRVEDATPPLAGRLASGVDFVQSGAGERSPLAERAIREVVHRMASVRFDEIARTGPAHRLLGLALLARRSRASALARAGLAPRGPGRRRRALGGVAAGGGPAADGDSPCICR